MKRQKVKRTKIKEAKRRNNKGTKCRNNKELHPLAFPATRKAKMYKTVENLIPFADAFDNGFDPVIATSQHPENDDSKGLSCYAWLNTISVQHTRISIVIVQCQVGSQKRHCQTKTGKNPQA